MTDSRRNDSNNFYDGIESNSSSILYYQQSDALIRQRVLDILGPDRGESSAPYELSAYIAAQMSSALYHSKKEDMDCVKGWKFIHHSVRYTSSGLKLGGIFFSI